MQEAINEVATDSRTRIRMLKKLLNYNTWSQRINGSYALISQIFPMK
jgi:hypothetical protein